MTPRLFASHDGHDVELRLCHRIGPDYCGPVYAVIVDGAGGTERYVDLPDAMRAAEERVGVALRWEERHAR